MLERLAEIGLEGCDAVGIAGRQHPPVGDLEQQHFGFERRRFLGEFGFFRDLDEFLHVGRKLVAVGKQPGTPRDHLLDGIAEGVTFDLQILDILGDLPVGGAALFRDGSLHGHFHRLCRFVQQSPGFGVGLLVVIEGVAENSAADSLKFSGDFTGPDRILGLQRHGTDLRANFSQLPHRKARQARAKQHEGAKAGIEPAANSETKKRHEPVLARAVC